MKNKQKEQEKLSLEIVKQMLRLTTSGFGLVAALAWNEAIKEFIADYIKPVVGFGSGLISLLIYAVIVTVLAVFITYQLAKLGRRLEEKREEKEE